MTSDRELLSQWAAQADEAAFGALVERHAGLVHGVAVRSTGGNQALAREIGQNVFTMLARKARTLTGHTSLASWLHRATLLESAHQSRKEATHSRRVAAFAAQLTETTMNPPPDDASQELILRLDKALAGLRGTDRALLLERFFEERSYREIAESSGTNEAAVRKRTERALEQLARRLSRRGVVVSSMMAARAAQGALTHAAPAGFAGSVFGGALAAAPAVSGFQLAMHTLRLMTFQKSVTVVTALAVLLLCFGVGFSASRLSGSSGPADRDAGVPGFPENQHSGRSFGGLAGVPGDTTESARVRGLLKRISKGFRVNLASRSIGTVLDYPGMPGGADGMLAMAEIGDGDAREAWKLLPDFRGKSDDFEGLAAFIAALRCGTEGPLKVLNDLLKPDFRVDGKPPQFAVFFTVGQWFSQDPQAAWAWILEAVPAGHYPFDRRRPWGEGQMSEWLGKDPAAALAALTPLPEEWGTFTRKALGSALENQDRRKSLWPVLRDADDRTAMMTATSQPARSEWARDVLLPWLMTREWQNGGGPERIAHEWTWRDGALDTDRLAMLCESVGTLPTPEANAAAAGAVRGVLGKSATVRDYFLKDLITDPKTRQRILKIL